MAKQQKEDIVAAIISSLQCHVLYMLGDIAAGPAYRFSQWLKLVSKRSGTYRSSGFRNSFRVDSMPSRPSKLRKLVCGRDLVKLPCWILNQAPFPRTCFLHFTMPNIALEDILRRSRIKLFRRV